MKKILMSVLAISAMSSSVYAGCNSKTCIDPEGVFRVVPTGGGVLIRSHGNARNLSCTPVGSGENIYIYLKKTHPTFKETYATILSAMTSGTHTVIRASADSDGKCQVSYMYITQ